MKSPSATTGKRAGAILGVLAVALAVLGVGPAFAATATLTNPPERLYTGVNTGFGFTGQDLISGDDRELVVSATAPGCNPNSGNGYLLVGCAAVQLDVSHGELAVPMPTVLGQGNDPDGITASGAIVNQSTNGDGTGKVIYLNGDQTELNDALALLTYTPDQDYEYLGFNPETLGILTVDGDPNNSGSTSYDVEIRVEGVNDGPTLTVPVGESVAAGSTTHLPAVPPAPSTPSTPGDFNVTDPDIDEGETDDLMLLLVFSTCGEFTLRGSQLTLSDTLQNMLANEVGLGPDAAAAVIAALPPEVTSIPFTTGSPMDPHQALLGLGSMDDVVYTLSDFGFIAPATAASCDVWTIVTDLGNNGLPAKYVGSPIGGRDQPQPGYEVPALGVDFGITNFEVDGGVEVSVPAALSVTEGSTLQIPVSVSSALHPAFDVGLASTGVTATGGGTDYDDATTPITYMGNDPGPVNSDLITKVDALPEGDETLTVTIDLAGVVPGVTVGNDTVTITITDDPPATTTTTSPSTTLPNGSTTTTTSSTTQPNGSTTTTTSSTTQPNGSTTTTTSSTTQPATTTTTTSSTTQPATTTTTTSSTTQPNGSTTTTTDPGTTTTSTTDPGGTTTTDPGAPTSTTDPADVSPTSDQNLIGGSGSTGGNGLARTGSDIGSLVGLASLLVFLGTVVLAASRRLRRT